MSERRYLSICKKCRKNDYMFPGQIECDECLYEKLKQENEELKNFCIWMTGCGYDFASLPYFCEQRDKLLKDYKASDNDRVEESEK